MNDLFAPNPGYDACAVFVAERTGAVTELQSGYLQLHPDYDACVISGLNSGTRYAVSQKTPNQVTLCNLHGYEANTGPFQTRINAAGDRLLVHSPQIASAAQEYAGFAPQPIVININAADMKLSNKRGPNERARDFRAVRGPND